MNRLPEITRPMSIKERLSLRKTLDVSANELELLELIQQCGGMSLQKMADELGMVKSGVDKLVLRLIEKGLLIKTAGKPNLSERSQIVLQSGTKIENVLQSGTTYKEESLGNSTEIVLQSGTKPQNVLQSGTIGIGGTVADSDFVLQSGTPNEIVVKSSTILGTDPHTHVHGGSSILLNNFFESLKEEKNKEEKINPPNPLDKKQENKKEEMRVRRQNRAARVMICGLMLHKVKIRKGKRLKRLPKRKPVKIINIPFDEWWNLYDYKVDRSPKLEKKWENLTNAERQTAMEHTALYVKVTPGKAYRKYPSTYLNNKSFNNEIVQNNGNNRKATGTPQKLRATNLIPIATPAGYKFGNVIKASDIDVPDID
jgi:DNA-binding MarR family transcriptional regulator